MNGLIPYANLYHPGGGAVTQALSTTMAALNLSALGVLDGLYTAGDVSVRPDKANNRMLVAAPGIYESLLRLNFTSDGAQIIVAQLRKGAANAGVLVGTKGQRVVTAAAGQDLVVPSVFQITAADLTAALAQDNFPATSAAGFGGASGATKSSIAVDVGVASVAGTPTITLVEFSWTLKRIG